MNRADNVLFRVKGDKATVAPSRIKRLPLIEKTEALRRLQLLGAAVAGFARPEAPAAAPAPAPAPAAAASDSEREMREFEARWAALVGEEFDDLKDFLNQSPTVRAVPGGYGLFYTDTDSLMGSGDMFDRYIAKSESKSLAEEIAKIVKAHSKTSAAGNPYILQEDLPAIRREVLRKQT
jgi:hypothetical protein